MTADLEYRAGVELRAVAGRKLAGYAAVFGTVADLGRFRERIVSGAFTATLAARSDVVALVDHDRSRVLGRLASGTLRLSQDARGLAFELDVPPTALGNDIIILAERRDLGGMSFGFKMTDEAWPEPDLRELRAVDLVEVSVAQAWPAYPDTTVVAVRARGAPGTNSLDVHARQRLLEML